MKTKMDRTELNRYREKLNKLRNEISEEVKHISQDAASTSQEELSRSSSGYGTHMADVASESFERDFSLNMASKEAGIVHDIEDALKKIENKTFGICEVCEKQIPKTRLDALPYVKFCKKCQEHSEHAENL